MTPVAVKIVRAAVNDIDFFLDGDKKRENAREEAGKRYDLMDELLDEGWTPPKGKARGKHRLTKTQYNALVHRTTNFGNPLTDEKREAILAGLDVEAPTSDAGREAFAFWARGGWLESSRQAAIWLQKAEKTVAADGIEVALSNLPDRPSDAKELPAYREAMRTAAKYVRTILKIQLEEQASTAEDNQNEDRPPDELLAELTKQQRRMIEFIWDKPVMARHKFEAHIWKKKVIPSKKSVERQIERLDSRLIELEEPCSITINDEFVKFERRSAK